MPMYGEEGVGGCLSDSPQDTAAGFNDVETILEGVLGEFEVLYSHLQNEHAEPEYGFADGPDYSSEMEALEIAQEHVKWLLSAVKMVAGLVTPTLGRQPETESPEYYGDLAYLNRYREYETYSDNDGCWIAPEDEAANLDLPVRQ